MAQDDDSTEEETMPMACVENTAYRVLLGIAAVGLSSIAAFAQGSFAVVPTWDGITACSGRPISSPSPAFSVTGVPAGTVTLEFRLVDLDVPEFNHGGGKVRYTGEARIAPGAFQFIGPCPPRTHRYEWTVTARDAASKPLGEIRVVKAYP
jgi:phosphatidylethanolamine-binding protein (PEBP) family uncharacterized protein